MSSSETETPMKSHGLYWQGWNKTHIEAYIELTIHTIACIIITILILTYLRFIHCKNTNPTKHYLEKSPFDINFQSPTSNLQPTLAKTPVGSVSIPSGHSTPKTSKPVTPITPITPVTDTPIDARLKKFILASFIASFIYIYYTYANNFVLILIFGIRNQNGCFYRSLTWFVCTHNLLLLYFFHIYRLFLGIQRIIIYSFFLIRLYITFENSLFEIKIKYIYLIISILIVTILASFTGFIIVDYQTNGFSCDMNVKRLLMFTIIIFVDLLWGIILSVFYIIKLKEILRLSGMESIQYMYVARKLTILACVAFASTVLGTIFGIFGGVLKYEIACMDQIINNMCALLAFAAMDIYFKKICCCCVNVANKCVMQVNKDVIELEQHI